MRQATAAATTGTGAAATGGTGGRAPQIRRTRSLTLPARRRSSRRQQDPGRQHWGPLQAREACQPGHGRANASGRLAWPGQAARAMKLKAERGSKMEVHVAAAAAGGGEGRVQGRTMPSPPVLGAARRPAGTPVPPGRREICCRGCGYGAVVAHPISRCPMCGGGDWQLARAEVTAGDGEVVW